MLKCECNEKHARLECEPLPNGLTLVRVYEDEQEITREAVSYVDTPWHGYSYTTYETVTQVPDGQVDVDTWAALVKQADHDAAAAAVRAERDKLIAATDWTVLGDAKTVKADWKAYRQALRDVPEQAGFPYAVEWPTPPGKDERGSRSAGAGDACTVGLPRGHTSRAGSAG